MKLLTKFNPISKFAQGWKVGKAFHHNIFKNFKWGVVQLQNYVTIMMSQVTVRSIFAKTK